MMVSITFVFTISEARVHKKRSSNLNNEGLVHSSKYKYNVPKHPNSQGLPEKMAEDR